VRTLSDLQTSGKYGYRGIALSALVSMATVEIRTRTQESEIGMRLIISEDGKRRTKEEIKKKNSGTKIKVTDLSDRLVSVAQLVVTPLLIQQKRVRYPNKKCWVA